METQNKRQAIQKKLNEFTSVTTPGQMTKLGDSEVNHYFRVYLGRDATEEERKVYANHPDSTKLEKHLQLMRKDKPPVQQQPVVNPGGMGQGGLSNPFDSYQNIGQFGAGSVADPNTPNFHDALARGISAMGDKIKKYFVPIKQAGANVWNGVKNTTTGKGFRTDRHNNPTAFTTDVAKTFGLQEGVDYVQGDAFPNNPNLRTAKLLGDPIATTIKGIDRGGFYTASGKPRWTYTNSIPGVNNWKNLNNNQKASIIAQMYKHEGGSGALLKGRGGSAQGAAQTVINTPTTNTPPQFKNLGNITTNFGDSTRDEPFHAAVDIANQKGTPIPEFNGGTVTQVGQHPDYGNFVTVKDDQGNTEQYSHLYRAMVRPGQRLSKNQMVGQMGDSGNTYSPSGGDPSHLHYSVTDIYNRVVNPTTYLNQNQTS